MNSQDAALPVEIDVQQAAQMARDENAVFLDVREPMELQVCRIGQPLHIPTGEIPSKWDSLPKDKKLLVYCHHGLRSLMVVNFLRQQGMDNACSVRGGINTWSIEIDPSVQRY